MSDVDIKVDRLARFARSRGLAAVLISTQPNFSWLSDGRTNRIDASVEAGQGSLLITADAERYIVANTIEMPRLHDEALDGLGFKPVEYPWADDHADPSAPLRAASRVVKGTIGSDMPLGESSDVNADVVALQTPLTDAELQRYRSLGREVATSLEHLARSLQPGATECDVAAQVNSAMALLGARAVVTLVAADDRVAAFRHPVPTTRQWRHTLLVGLCAERQGLVVALSRMLSSRSATLRPITDAALTVLRRLLAETRPGATGRDLFAAASAAYRDAGHPGQEDLHHQGGAIGYRSRDWIAHPQSSKRVSDRQAFAWNPSITGTKVEDTALLVDGATELITVTGGWPGILDV